MVYGLDDRGFESRQELGVFIFTIASRLALGSTQLPIQWVPGSLSLGVKRTGSGAILPLPQYAFLACAQLKHRDDKLRLTGEMANDVAHISKGRFYLC
jgi:hypothetical protein